MYLNELKLKSFRSFDEGEVTLPSFASISNFYTAYHPRYVRNGVI
jgi:hypothetical protein